VTLKQAWRNVRPAVLAPLVFAVARTIGATLRIESRNEPAPGPEGRVLAGWHGRTFVAAVALRGRGVYTIISLSKDGDMQDRIFRWFGFRTIRGSTGRGGVRALRESIGVLQAGQTMAFTPDGPRGPSGTVQAGIVAMAKRSGVALVPVGVSATRRWLAPTWDRYMVPKPFARCLMLYGDPVLVPPDADEATLEGVRARLESEMHRLEAEAEAACGHAPA
jgi:lysophospholipid acyltransferase (LPLAT)-like uncharacterized protein